MADLQLSLMMSLNPRSEAVLNGSIQPEGIDLACTIGHPSEIFWRQLKFAEFDVSEMSLSSLLVTIAGGNREWIGLPIFTMRRFFHTWIWVRRDRIERPEDLKGKKVGVPEYQQTAALWSRGVLQHEFGVAPEDMEWFMERTPDRSHGGASGGVTGSGAPPGVRIHQIPPENNIGSMLVSGELDATLLYSSDVNLVDRSRVRLEDHPQLRLLFDPEAEARRYYAKTGLYPINHGMVVRRSIVEKHPWVALNIFNAFRIAKERSQVRLREMAETYFQLGLLPLEAHQGLAEDPYPYGAKSNKHVLETIAAYSHEQGLTPRKLDLSEVFAAPTLDL